MELTENVSLKPFNTFGIDVTAKYFAKFASMGELDELFSSTILPGEMPHLVIGGGSNLLLTQPYNGLVAKNEVPGMEVTEEDDEHIYVRVGAGENWHRLVMYCVENNFAGMENLSLIPGSVGASPMQNIGAYGVEIKDVFHKLEAYAINDRKEVQFSAGDCEFGYRESVFKKKYKGQFVITNVTFRLDKRPQFHTEYGAIRQELDKMGVQELSIAAISQAVINIRRSKLPDPRVIGNAGSFFKNPTITRQQFEDLQSAFSCMVGYPAGEEVKVAAGWLIEQCGWKGYRKGDAGCHAKQALVLVNYGNAKGKDVYDLSTEIVASVAEKFGINLDREVNVF